MVFGMLSSGVVWLLGDGMTWEESFFRERGMYLLGMGKCKDSREGEVSCICGAD